MKLTPTEARLIYQTTRIRKMTEFLPIAKHSQDRRKLRRWVNQVTRMTRYHVKANGILSTSTLDSHRSSMKKFRHTLPEGLK